jgi:hypothetical protein
MRLTCRTFYYLLVFALQMIIKCYKQGRIREQVAL